jgi:hypothetical protein
MRLSLLALAALAVASLSVSVKVLQAEGVLPAVLTPRSLLLALGLVSGHPAPPPLNPGLFKVIGEVDRVTCTVSDEAACVKAVGISTVPFVLKGTSASRWPAQARWKDLAYLGRVVPGVVTGVRVRTGSRVFTSAQDKPDQLPDVLGSRATDPVLVNQTMAELLRDAQHPEDEGTFRMWTGLLSGLESPELLADAHPVNPYTMGSDHAAVTLWVSQPGNVAHTHYDKSVNFVAQVVGRKRWLLFAPAEWRALYPYPGIHRAYHQSQMNLSAPDADLDRDFPGARFAEAYEVILEPGEVLYVPPFWFHTVETLDEVSVGVSIITPSIDEVRYSEAYWRPVPFQKDWPASVRAKYVAEYIRTLIRQTDAGGDPSDFVRTVLLENRWRALLAPLEAHWKELEASPSGPPAPRITNCSPKFGELDAFVLAQFDQAVRESTGKLNLIKDTDIRLLCLANIVEEISRFASGDPLQVPHFFKVCFQQDFKAQPAVAQASSSAAA